MRKYILTTLLITICVLTKAQNKSYTFVFLNNKPDKEVLSKEKSDSIMQGHMNNIGRLAKEGKLLAAGPFEGGGGIFILSTKSEQQAKEWLSTDPGIKANRWNIEILHYTPYVGSLCPVGEKYEMTFYQFVRFTIPGEISEASIKQHTDFIDSLTKEGNVISEGPFGYQKGGVLILKSEIAKEKIEEDPAVKAGALKFEIKKLYIAKGSFCEK